MASRRAIRRGLIALGVLLLLIVGALAAIRVTVGILRDQVTEALGPQGEIGELRLGWSAVEVAGLRIKARPGWPAADTLRADRVVIVPSFRGLLSGQLRASSVTVIRPYLSALRTRDGNLRVIPSLLAGRGAKGDAKVGVPARELTISRITLQDGAMELFDATVAQPPLRIRLEQIEATVHEIVAPTLAGKNVFEIAGVLKGVRRDGRVHVSGWAKVATKESSVKTQVRGADLVALQPYLTQATDAQLERGVLDLDLSSEVRNNRLRAPGTVVIADLAFAPSEDSLETFMGLPRDTVLALLKNKDNRIELDFVLEGDISDPEFTLNEAFTTRVTSAMAERLGVSIRGVVKGVGGLERKSLEAAKRVRGALQRLLGEKD